ncbi:MAG: hypothetical protein WA116_05985 [Anaerolineaceae bacterium]
MVINVVPNLYDCFQLETMSTPITLRFMKAIEVDLRVHKTVLIEAKNADTNWENIIQNPAVIQTVQPDSLLNQEEYLTRGEKVDLCADKGIFTRNQTPSAYIINYQAMNYVFQDL